ncbi:MAG TPA: hypothetical protein DCL21_05245 [Alphaproteobacteria bacterium]|nr:hypothetical protein [Alphaproteobacteria bacterium]
MIQRATDDRRIKKVKVSKNNRKIRRRKEDHDNIKAYYGVLGLSIGIFAFIGIISFVWGR